MGKSHLFFLPSSSGRAFVCLLLFVGVLLEAKDCKVRLKESVEINYDSEVKRKTSTIDHAELFDESRGARKEAKQEGSLKVTQGSELRSPEQIDAWFANFSNRIKAAKLDPTKKMSIEEFFGMIDGGFGRHGFHFEDVFKDFGIRHVKFSGKGDFSSKILKEGKGADAKDTLFIEVPDFPVDKPELAAIWMKDFYLTLHDAATNMVAHKVNTSAAEAVKSKETWVEKRAAAIVENVSGQKAQAIYNNEYKKRVRDMDRGVRLVLLELDAYLKAKNPAEDNPLDLKSRSLSPDLWYHAVSLYKATDSVVGGELASKAGSAMGGGVDTVVGSHGGGGDWGGFAGGLGGTAFGIFTKIRFPLESWKPSQKWLLSKEAFEIERARLESRLESYYKYRAIGAVADLYAKGSFLVGVGAMGFFYYQNRSFTGDAEEGMQDEKEKASKELDTLTEDQLVKLNVKELQETYSRLVAEEKELNRQKAEAIAKKDLAKADKLNERLIAKAEYMKKVFGQIEALNPDGLENER